MATSWLLWPGAISSSHSQSQLLRTVRLHSGLQTGGWQHINEIHEVHSERSHRVLHPLPQRSAVSAAWTKIQVMCRNYVLNEWLDGPLDAEQKARLMEIADKCPVHRTLTSEIRIETRMA